MKRSIKRNGVESLMSCENHNLNLAFNPHFPLCRFPSRML
jgi:hypothetical protein